MGSSLTSAAQGARSTLYKLALVGLLVGARATTINGRLLLDDYNRTLYLKGVCWTPVEAVGSEDG